jgi:hypothetical protein
VLLSVEPLVSLTFDPSSLLGDIVLIGVEAFTVLLSIEPLAVVFLVVGPGEDASAFFLVVLVFADVASAVLPGEHTFSVHVSVHPVAVVLATIRPPVSALAFHLALREITNVSGVVVPFEFTFTTLESLFELPFENVAIRIGFLSLAILHVVRPVSFVFDSCLVNEGAEAVSLVVLKFTFVDLAVRVNEAALAVGLVGLPETFVVLAVDPGHFTLALLLAVPRDLAFVGGFIVGLNSDFDLLSVDLLPIAIVEGVHSALHCVYSASRLSDLVDREIRTNLRNAHLCLSLLKELLLVLLLLFQNFAGLLSFVHRLNLGGSFILLLLGDSSMRLSPAIARRDNDGRASVLRGVGIKLVLLTLIIAATILTHLFIFIIIELSGTDTSSL